MCLLGRGKKIHCFSGPAASAFAETSMFFFLLIMLAESSEKEGWVEGVWELWKAKVIKAAVGKKKVNEHSKGWWSTEVEMAIQARKEACRKLREARRTVKQDEILEEKWNTHKNKRRLVKKLIRKEKKEMRKRTLRKIKQQKGQAASCFGQT